MGPSVAPWPSLRSSHRNVSRPGRGAHETAAPGGKRGYCVL
eukprot:CAMPEP_0195114786 /NCGR_PEP_ID=MMETSP0448-20130528/107011_1 /TAXON_ID=66468 /ORGANISM="Heterocapsa triquestra, Strain CCMP 448" /LENGTH=40 /DNA_ID= /DNA_START= /DNA_END= /DNA_ORIENTATION=